MRLLVTGDREWTDKSTIEAAFDNLKPSLVIHGGARGADLIAVLVAIDRGIPTIRFNADWTRYHKGAGPIRNQQMLDEGQPDCVVYFHNNLEISKGTKDMVQRSRKAGLMVYDGLTISKDRAI